jgi:hypothetical protein
MPELPVLARGDFECAAAADLASACNLFRMPLPVRYFVGRFRDL